MVFDAKFVTYKGTYKEIKTEKLNVPTSDGIRGILSNHMPIMLPLIPGVIETLENKKICHYVISNGIMYFEDNNAIITCHHIVDVEDIQVAYFEERKQAILDKIATLDNEEDKQVYKNELAFIDEAIKIKEN
ncbi:MAG: F0F1 ATP synthase subunit epsilon [Erysipelotrichaceae bacterium]|nr:F0F1 ATP synthase subunit epsilon [Erysipelotrichaceae bacterium]